ncbi:MAG: DUF1508 domain-containing protein [Gammaproteobacteria bacterium]|nr:DUF1508 domain-containing protein [Gammaproteobacteria bacterium]
MSGKFELYKDARERYRFRLISESGELVLSGEGYTQKVLALDAIVSIMKSAAEAAVIDMTLPAQDEIAIEGDSVLWEEEQYELDERDPPSRKKKKKKKQKSGKKHGKGKKEKKSKECKKGKKSKKRKQGKKGSKKGKGKKR